MNRIRCNGLILLCLGAAVLLFNAPAFSQDARPALRMNSGFSFEYFSRTVDWDVDASINDSRSESPMKVLLGLLHLDYEIQKGTLVGVLVGYGLTDLNGLIFRQLPFSIDYQAGNIGGFLTGAEIDQHLFASDYFEMKALAQFVIYFGSTKNLQVTSLNIEGHLKAKPDDWMRVQIGPVFSYRGFEYFSPFLSLSYNKLWGKFTMAETIGDLKGSEEKKITSKNAFSISLGTLFEASPSFSLKAEGAIMPYHKGSGQGWGFDYGGRLKAIFVF